MGHEPDDDTNFEGSESLCRLSGFVRLLCCGRLPASGLCLSLRAGSTLAHKLVKSRFVCQPGSASQLDSGQRWHTNWFIQVLCASRALPLTCAEANFGTQIGFFRFCVPRRLRFSHIRRGKMKNLWHTKRPNLKSCATPPQPPPKNEKSVAHKSPEFNIVCHSSSTYAKK